MKFLKPLALLIFFVPALLHAEDEGTWRTAFVKRGFVGQLGAPDSVLRSILPLPMDGTKVRIYLEPSRDNVIELTRMTLAKAADSQGGIVPPPYAITFGGKPGLEIPVSKGKSSGVVSDDVTVPVTTGLWYLQQSYIKGTKVPYSYDVDGQAHAAAHEDAKPSDEVKAGSRWGAVWRVDVLTKDTRPLIACYGDSITQGFGVTPMSGNRYPALMSKELDQPVLNLGVNGDLIKYGAGAIHYIDQLAGVNVVVFLMGVNDIMTGSVKTVDDYAVLAKRAVTSFHDAKLKVVWGTIPPGTGFIRFSDDPAKETLRVAINKWIRENVGADAIADFDAALTDPKDPKLLNYNYQKDWLHPNDAGNQLMAKVAAEAVRKAEATPLPAATPEKPATK